MSIDDTIVPVAWTGRPPVVLQVLPSLVSGGAERGTVELAGLSARPNYARARKLVSAAARVLGELNA